MRDNDKTLCSQIYFLFLINNVVRYKTIFYSLSCQHIAKGCQYFNEKMYYQHYHS